MGASVPVSCPFEMTDGHSLYVNIIAVRIQSRGTGRLVGTHRIKNVSPAWPFGGEQSLHLVEEFSMAENMKETGNQDIATYNTLAESVNACQVIVVNKNHIAVGCLLGNPDLNHIDDTLGMDIAPVPRLTLAMYSRST